jgi:hypothetical protein
VRALRGFLRRVEAERTPGERAQALAREAIFAGMDGERWAEARAATLDLALLRAVHRALPGADSRVRRADRDGRWRLADARPGMLRTKPQSFRSGDHVEPAWEPGAIKAGLARLLHEVGPAFADDPVHHGAHLLWAITRAQPFAGHNVRLALTIVSLCLRRADLPALAVVDAERDAALIAGLARATADRTPLERVLEHLIWREALAFAEWLAPVASDAARWTLAGEAEALAATRARVVAVSEATVERIAARAIEVVTPGLTMELGVDVAGGVARWVGDPGERLALAWTSAARGRWLCPHAPLRVATWSLGGTGVEAHLVIGGAGRGLSGAAVAHLALGSPAPGAPPAPALLLIPDEADDEWQTRLAAWVAPALASVRRESPFRF